MSRTCHFSDWSADINKPCMAFLANEASVSITKPKENKVIASSISQGGGNAAELVCQEHRLHQEDVQASSLKELTSLHGVFPT